MNKNSRFFEKWRNILLISTTGRYLYWNAIVSFLWAVAVYVVFYFAVANTCRNLLYKLIADFLFLITFLLVNKIMERIKSSQVVILLVNTVSSAALLFWMLANFIKEANMGEITSILQWFRYACPKPFYIVLVSLVVTIFFANIQSTGGKYRTKIAFFYSILCCATTMTRNVFMDMQGMMHHSNAYENSIFNVIYGEPFSAFNKSIYGHYSIFFEWPVKLLEAAGMNRFIAVSYLISFMAFVTCFCVIMSLKKVIKSDAIFYLGMLSMGSISFQMLNYGNFYQQYPHRTVFPAIITFIIVYFNGKKIEKYLTAFFCVLAMIWNTEVGGVCLIAVAMYNVAVKISGKKIISVESFKTICIEAVKSVALFFGALLSVNLWNLTKGGGFVDIPAFMYPMMSNTYKIELLELKIPSLWNSWFMVSMIFLVCMAAAFIYGVFREKKSVLFLLPSAVMGLGTMSLYMNRPHQLYLCICYPMVIMILTVWLQFLYDEYRRLNYNLLFLVCFLTTTLTLSVQSIDNLNFSQIVIRRLETTWNIDVFEKLIYPVRDNVPEGTMGFGVGVPEIYAYLSRDTMVHVMDWADIPGEQEAVEYVYSKAEQEPMFFAAEDAVREPERFTEKGFKVIKEFEYFNYKFQLWEKQ